MKRGQLLIPGAARCVYPYDAHACSGEAVIDAGRVHVNGLASTPLCAMHAKKLGYGPNEPKKRPSARAFREGPRVIGTTEPRRLPWGSR